MAPQMKNYTLRRFLKPCFAQIYLSNELMDYFGAKDSDKFFASEWLLITFADTQAHTNTQRRQDEAQTTVSQAKARVCAEECVL